MDRRRAVSERRAGASGGGTRDRHGRRLHANQLDAPCGLPAADTADTGTRQRHGPASPAGANPDTESAGGPLPGHWSRLVAKCGVLTGSEVTSAT